MKAKIIRLIAFALALACLGGCSARLQEIGADFMHAVDSGELSSGSSNSTNNSMSGGTTQTAAPVITQTDDGSYDAASVFALCSPSVVWVQTPNGGGTGFFVEEDIIATNNHVISGAGWANVQTVDGSIYTVTEIIARSDNPDLALLRIDGSGVPVTPNTHGVTEGEPVYTIGAPMGIFPTLSDGIVMKSRHEDWDVRYILTNVHTIGGNSGGPLFNRYGEVMGVVVGGMSDGPNAIDLIIHIDHLNDLDRSRPEPMGTYEEYIEEMNAPEEGKYAIVPLADARPGQVVRFGRYEQDADEGNGQEDILWLVLERNGNELKLMSLYCLDTMPYSENPGEVTWETSFVRAWLNEVFYSQAFTGEERKLLISTPVVNADNPNHGTPGGNDTEDMVYLLSLEEVMHYWGIENAEETFYDRLYAPATEYCMTKPIWLEIEGSNRCWWWLRSPGGSPEMAAEVGSMGYLSFNGTEATTPERAVRPVIHVNVG